MSYADFLARKRVRWDGRGFPVASLPDNLFPWQAAVVRWAARKGKAAVFADCGLGKTPIQLAWAAASGQRALILAPLCVAEQTVAEAPKFGLAARYVATDADIGDGINVTNYERLHRFDVSRFGAVVLDESSILKAFDGKTRTALIGAFADTPYRLCCTATPAPNDIAELANHAEFLGLMRTPEFLATWFVHDDAGWRMKRHAAVPFFRWMASWSLALRTPADIGYANDGYDLPPLAIRERTVACDVAPEGMLFAGMSARGMRGRLGARRASLGDRVAATVDLVERNPGQWILWCGLNDESSRLAAEIPGSVEVRGQDSHEDKVAAVRAFTAGDVRVLVSKPRILGFGMNFQNCAQMAFVGIGDSYEQYYQCIRRCWRFGQKRPVTAWIVTSDAEFAVVENVRRKERDAALVAERLIENMKDFEREELCA